MSYILDALNRADTERERGAAPSLHSRHTMPELQPKTVSASVLRVWRVVEAVAVVGFAVLGWWWWQTSQQAPEPSAKSTPAVAPLVVAAPAAVQTAPALPLVLAASAPVMAAASTPVPSVPNRPVAKAKAAASGVASAALVNLPLLSELPESLRSQLPKITINGSVYSEQASQRLLLVNNLVLNEGAEVSKELRLERIQPHSSEFSFKGTRFRLTH